jgi:hypothetical protein
MAGLDDRVAALEQDVQKLKDFLKRGLSNFEDTDPLGFDISDSSFNASHRQYKAAPVGYFITDVSTYVEDGHIKMVFICKKLPTLKS